MLGSNSRVLRVASVAPWTVAQAACSASGSFQRYWRLSLAAMSATRVSIGIMFIAFISACAREKSGSSNLANTSARVIVEMNPAEPTVLR